MFNTKFFHGYIVKIVNCRDWYVHVFDRRRFFSNNFLFRKLKKWYYIIIMFLLATVNVFLIRKLLDFLKPVVSISTQAILIRKVERKERLTVWWWCVLLWCPLLLCGCHDNILMMDGAAGYLIFVATFIVRCNAKK